MSGKPEGSPRKGRPPISLLGSRLKAMGTTQWEAYTVGFTLVGGILLGAGTGWWLDQKFGTSFFLPVLFLVGVLGGFREMLLTIQRINRETARRQKADSGPLAGSGNADIEASDSAPAEKPRAEKVDPLHFSVPSPPSPSWERRDSRQLVDEGDSEKNG